MKKEWLQKKLILEELSPMDRFEAGNLIAQMQPGDELWKFRSPSESWQHLAGRAGIALVRKGKVIAGSP